jgi:hypothetical protein
MEPFDEVDLRAVFEACEPEVLEMLHRRTPIRVVRELERRGWPRVWVCELVGRLEREHNPAGLKIDAELNNRLRDRHSVTVILGAVVFVIGWILAIVSTAPPFSGRAVIIVAYGAIAGGAIALWRGFVVLRCCPDRRVPGCPGPDGKEQSHEPGAF